MVGNYILFGAISLILTVVASYISSIKTANIFPNGKGEFLLRLPKLYNLLGFFSLDVCLIVGIGPLIIEKPDLTMFCMAFAMFLFFGVMGLLCIFFYRNHHVVFDDVTVKVQNVFKKTETLNWNDIIKASFNPFTSLLTLTGKNGQKVKIHYHLTGLTKFIALLESKTKHTAKNLRLPVW